MYLDGSGGGSCKPGACADGRVLGWQRLLDQVNDEEDEGCKGEDADGDSLTAASGIGKGQEIAVFPVLVCHGGHAGISMDPGSRYSAVFGDWDSIAAVGAIQGAVAAVEAGNQGGAAPGAGFRGAVHADTSFA